MTDQPIEAIIDFIDFQLCGLSELLMETIPVTRHFPDAFCTAMFMVLTLFVSHAAVGSDQPNLILLLADDLGWTGLSSFGSDLYETPHLDALAAQGMTFTNAYAACTVCSPTRASIMTGQSPARLHLTDFIAGQNRPYAKLKIPDWTKRLKSSHVTIAEILKAKGYRTGHVGKWHLNGSGDQAAGTQPTDQGFDFSFQRPPGTRGYTLKQNAVSASGSNYLTDLLTDKACGFIEQSKADPFFLYFAYNVPHTPIQGREDLVKHFQKKVIAAATHNNPAYAAMVASLDESVGRIVAKLDQQQLTSNTVIVFISDNGGLTQRNGKHDGFTENLPLRRGKGSAYEGGVRVPAIASWPGVTAAGAVCDEPIITTDLFPTFQQLTGGTSSTSTSMDGVSLVPLLHDASQSFDRDLFWHYPHYHAGGDGPYSAIRSGDHRLIEYHEDNSVRLYDLVGDIGEQHDLSAALPAKTSELRGKLHEWRAATKAQMPSSNPDYDPARASDVVRGRKKV